MGMSAITTQSHVRTLRVWASLFSLRKINPSPISGIFSRRSALLHTLRQRLHRRHIKRRIHELHALAFDIRIPNRGRAGSCSVEVLAAVMALDAGGHIDVCGFRLTVGRVSVVITVLEVHVVEADGGEVVPYTRDDDNRWAFFLELRRRRGGLWGAGTGGTGGSGRSG